MVDEVAGRPEWAQKLDDATAARFEAKGWLKKDMDPVDALSAVGKSYGELEKRIGIGALPPVDAKDVDAMKDWDGWKSLGVPDNADGYELADLDIPEGMQADTELDNAMRELAVEAKLAPFQLNMIRQKYAEVAGGRFKAQVDATKESTDRITGEVKAELGDGYAQGMENLKRFGREVAGEDWPDAVDAMVSAFGNAKGMLMAVRVANALADDSLPSGHIVPTDIEGQIKRLRDNPAYNDVRHPEHKQVNDQMQRLYKMKSEQAAGR